MSWCEWDICDIKCTLKEWKLKKKYLAGWDVSSMIRNLLHGISSGFSISFKALPDLLFLKHTLECNENTHLYFYVVNRLQPSNADFSVQIVASNYRDPET